MEVECLSLKDLSSPRKSFSVGPDTEGNGCQSDQKENVWIDRRRSTPLKTTETSIPTSIINRKGATPELVHNTPNKHTALNEPWTPTANLKMLISAASPDIRDREMKKMLFRPLENEKDKPASPDPVAEDTELEDSSQCEAMEEEDGIKKPSRKQKSLGLLCQKFLALYPDYPPLNSPIWISLDKVATNLGVERRRIYDIVNVLESLMIVGRMAKNSYTWHGRWRLEAMLKELQCRGRQQGYHLQMELATEAKDLGLIREDDGGEGDATNAAGNRKDKSLRIMSQKFVMLFLVSKTQTVTLDAAAKILIEESQDSSSHSKYKTKVRRLYDIANVLTSLSLIKKVHVREERGRKPAFKWLGPVEFKSSGNSPVTTPEATQQPMTGQDLRRNKMVRHASFNISPISVSVQRQVNSAPSSPCTEPPALPNQPMDYSRKTTVDQLQCGSSTNMCPSVAAHAHSSTSLPGSSTLMVPPPQPEHILPSPTSSHCLAYLPSLSHPSVVMLYSAPEKPEHTPEGQRSPRLEPEEGRKRKRDEGNEEKLVAKKKGMAGLEEYDMVRAEHLKEAAEYSPTGFTRMSPTYPEGHSQEQAIPKSPAGINRSEPTPLSHFLYVPNNAGLNSLNFFLSAGQSAAGLALPSNTVPTLTLPYVLVPSATISHYPLVASSLQQQGSDAQTKLSFSLPAVVPPAHYMVGAAPYGLAVGSEVNGSPAPAPSTPEQPQLYGTPHSPSGPRQSVGISTPEPQTPHTPKENMASASKSFFQTPATPGSVVSTGPAVRKRGSVQRRLDVGHPPNN